MMKNHKGQVATLLTLGLVLVGTLITLGTSLFVNNKKTNLASNSMAATSGSCSPKTSSNYDKNTCTGASKSGCLGNPLHCDWIDSAASLPATLPDCGMTVSFASQDCAYGIDTTGCKSGTAKCKSKPAAGTNLIKCGMTISVATANCSQGIDEAGCTSGTARCKSKPAPIATTAPSNTGCGSGGAYSCTGDGYDPGSCPTKSLEYNCCIKDNFSCGNGTSGSRYRWYGCTGQPCGNTKINQSNGPGKLVACPAGVNKNNTSAESGKCESELTPTPRPVNNGCSYSSQKECAEDVCNGTCTKCSGGGYKCVVSGTVVPEGNTPNNDSQPLPGCVDLRASFISKNACDTSCKSQVNNSYLCYAGQTPHWCCPTSSSVDPQTGTENGTLNKACLSLQAAGKPINYYCLDNLICSPDNNQGICVKTIISGNTPTPKSTTGFLGFNMNNGNIYIANNRETPITNVKAITSSDLSISKTVNLETLDQGGAKGFEYTCTRSPANEIKVTIKYTYKNNDYSQTGGGKCGYDYTIIIQ